MSQINPPPATEAGAITPQANATTEIPLVNATLNYLPGHLNELTAGLQGAVNTDIASTLFNVPADSLVRI